MNVKHAEHELLMILTKTCREYGITNSWDMPRLTFSGHLKSSNGICLVRGSVERIKRAARISPEKAIEAITGSEIKISKLMLTLFSFEDAKKTLMHEIAHYLDLIFNGEWGHGESFKKLCVDLGGSMNEILAGREYSAAATGNFVSRAVGYFYACPCGAGHKTTIKKISEKMLDRWCCPRCKKKIRHWTVTFNG